MITFVKQVNGQEQTFESQSFLGVISTDVKTPETPRKDTAAGQGDES